MNNSCSPINEFVFWLHCWKKNFGFVIGVSSENLVQCTINSYVIKTMEPIESDSVPLSVKLDSVTDCEIRPLNDISNFYVVWINTSPSYGRSYQLVPANPFDPPGFFYHNLEEAKALLEVVNKLRNGLVTDLHKNPYIRQAAHKNNPAYVSEIDEDWQSHVSPWHYYSKYNQQAERKRIIISNITRLMLFLILAAFILAMVWLVFTKT